NLILQGITRQSTIGFLTLYEHEGSSKVRDRPWPAPRLTSSPLARSASATKTPRYQCLWCSVSATSRSCSARLPTRNPRADLTSSTTTDYCRRTVKSDLP